ncbi:Fc.00g100950.m01.CDS01 [Cosmosporella sp. VM-42]
MAAPRESTFLPTIKCSSCGNQVEISMMGEHICSGPPAEPSPPQEAQETFNTYIQQPPPRQGRTPPSVDTKAANGAFMRQGQLTPNSVASERPMLSPLTPNLTPTLTPNARRTSSRTEDYFGQRMGNQRTSRSSRDIKRPGGYGGFADHEGSDVEPRSISESPGNINLMQRMNTIAPGPFDANSNRRPRTSSGKNAFQRSASFGRQEDDTLHAPAKDTYTQDRPGTATSNASTGSNSNIVPPRLPRKNGYEGFGPPMRTGDDLDPQPLGIINRSETFPKASIPMEPPLRTPSAPGTRPDRPKTQSGIDKVRRPSMAPDTSRPPPPRKSLIRPQTNKFAGSVDLAAEFGSSNPYHTPSDSGSSGYSTFSHPSHTSSQTSPARSQPRRQPSDGSNIDDLMNDLQNSMDSLRPKDLRIDLPPPQRTRSPLVESPYGTSPRDERHDPAIQSGRRIEPSPRKYDQPLPSPYGTSPRDQQAFDPAVQSARRPEPSSLAAPPVRKGSRDPTASRGDCKACKLPIKGKSISSADGRLTGKYHKACFVCATCSEPFTSAEFYVLDDKPYCEQHYHKLNGSLCGSCGKGIEGQYLEDEFVIKYHVGCFRCLDCGRSLSDGYFEVDGKSYCERDAWRRVQQPWLAGKGMASEPDSTLQPPPRGAPGSRPPKGMGASPGRPSQRPSGPGVGMGFPRPPYGLPSGNRLSPNMGAGPRMNKRNTRLGMM